MPVALGEFVGEFGDPVLGTPSNHVFDIKEDFGAIGDDGDDDGADDTQAFQDALDMAAQVKGGDIYLDDGVYKIAGLLQDPSGANAQLVLPSVSAPAGEQYAIRFIAKRPGSQIPWFGGGGNTPKTGAIVKSTLGVGDGALLGGKGPGGSFGDFTNITIGVENINFRMPANPGNSCLNFKYLNSAVIRNCVTDTSNWDGSTIPLPTGLTSNGIIMPRNDNGGNNWVDQVQIVGFANGFYAGEHCYVGQIEIYECIVGVNFGEIFHSSQFARLLYANCTYGLRWVGAHTTKIDLLDIEHTNLAAWYATTYDIDDASNYGRGQINYQLVRADFGVDYTAFLRNGGAGLSVSGLGTGHNPVHLADSAALNDTVYYSTTASKLVYKDSGGTVRNLY